MVIFYNDVEDRDGNNFSFWDHRFLNKKTFCKLKLFTQKAMISFSSHSADCNQYFEFLRNLLCNIELSRDLSWSPCLRELNGRCSDVFVCRVFHWSSSRYKTKFDHSFTFFIDLCMGVLKIFYTAPAKFFALIVHISESIKRNKIRRIESSCNSKYEWNKTRSWDCKFSTFKVILFLFILS